MEGSSNARRATPDASGPEDLAFEQVHAGTLAGYADLVRSLGGDPAAYMGRFGITSTLIEATAARMSVRAMIDLLEYTAERLGQPDFGLRLAQMQGGRVFGPIGVVMRNSRTFGEALHYVAAHSQAYCPAANLALQPEDEGKRHFAGLDILLDAVPNRAQLVEQHLLLAHRNAQDITGGRARARQVRFRHEPMAPLRSYRDYFGCDVRVDAPVDGIVFAQEDLDAPIVDPDIQIHEIAISFIDTKFPPVPVPMHARVRGLIRKHLGLSDCKIERIADALCMHPRTLHRRLQWEGKSFEDIKDEVRRDAALYYIERTRLPFTRISERLGYSETSVLSRSCLRWYGLPPRDMRARRPAAWLATQADSRPAAGAMFDDAHFPSDPNSL